MKIIENGQIWDCYSDEAWFLEKYVNSKVIFGKRITIYEISNADWKLFCERVPEWQEKHMEKLQKKYIKLLSGPGYASDHLGELEKRIKKDKKSIGVFIEM